MPRQLSLFKGKRQRGVELVAPLEVVVQCQIARALTLGADRRWRWTHFPAGELRDKITAKRLKDMGTKPGVPDFLLFAPSLLAHFLELKRKGGIISDDQQLWADWCNDVGYPHAIAYGYDDAIEVLVHWGVLRVSL
jgi:hypothetical protein